MQTFAIWATSVQVRPVTANAETASCASGAPHVATTSGHSRQPCLQECLLHSRSAACASLTNWNINAHSYQSIGRCAWYVPQLDQLLLINARLDPAVATLI
jgi:hypothetical protein